MTITTTTLTRAAGVAAVVGGLLYIGVQIKHPNLDLALVTTTQWKVRQTMKVLFASLSLAGITGMYLLQVNKAGALGLVGYAVFAVGYLSLLGTEFVSAFVLPSIAHSSPAYVSNAIAAGTNDTVTGDIGLIKTVLLISGLAYVAGGFIFGIALFRARVLARWAAALLAVGSLAAIATGMVPQYERLFAFPTGVALVGLGWSLWRTQRSPGARHVPGSVSAQLDLAGAK